jgi:hypothetical protein
VPFERAITIQGDVGKRNYAALAAPITHPAQFHHRPDIGKAGMVRGFDQGAGKLVIIDMFCATAGVADQEDAIMAATGVAVGDIGIGTFNPPRKIGFHEQIEDAIDGIGGDPLAARFRDVFGNVIGRSRAFAQCERTKDISAHFGPLLTGLDQRGFGG